ncbi:hypothetical protein VN12_25115 [Pirellula sp. SH-Sr6A]|nr:hypothetical protein VN12_25115 [Pirellula sp. SH-Sr6A]
MPTLTMFLIATCGFALLWSLIHWIERSRGAL